MLFLTQIYISNTFKGIIQFEVTIVDTEIILPMNSFEIFITIIYNNV